MGYRHIMVSDTMVPKLDRLPQWFIQKWKDHVDFTGNYWNSHDEYKRFFTMEEFPEDVQKVLIELNERFQVTLLWFADEDNGMWFTHITRGQINDHPVKHDIPEF